MLRESNLMQTTSIFMWNNVYMALIDNIDPINLLVILILKCVLKEIHKLRIVFVLINFEYGLFL